MNNHVINAVCLLGLSILLSACTDHKEQDIKKTWPIVVSTWDNQPANKTALETIENGGSALDGIEAGIRITESDTTDQSVGVGGLPDQSGIVTLDACIMDHTGQAGSVTFVEGYPHPISIARRVMEETDHVMLSGKGAEQFAADQGFEQANLLTQSAKAKWEEWKAKKSNADNHDTIGMLAIDKDGNLSGGCSTSGMAYKLPGRVGDSPIIGAGLFVDNAVGAATATGKGEEVMKTVGSFLIVELMRQGYSPQEACEIGVKRIVENNENLDFQIGYLAIDKLGRVGAYAVDGDFVYTKSTSAQTTVNQSLSYSD